MEIAVTLAVQFCPAGQGAVIDVWKFWNYPVENSPSLPYFYNHDPNSSHHKLFNKKEKLWGSIQGSFIILANLTL